MDPVVHFEMPYEDSDRAAKFYSSAFGWVPRQLGQDMGGYVTVATSDSDEVSRMPKEPGRINGGLFKRTKPDQGILVTISVDDIYASMKKIQDAGGKIVGGMQTPGQPDEIPGVGLYISFTDSEGNKLSLLQPKSMNSDK